MFQSKAFGLQLCSTGRAELITATHSSEFWNELVSELSVKCCYLHFYRLSPASGLAECNRFNGFKRGCSILYFRR